MWNFNMKRSILENLKTNHSSDQSLPKGGAVEIPKTVGKGGGWRNRRRKLKGGLLLKGGGGGMISP